MNPSLERALLLYQQERHEMAAAEARQALADDPHNAFGHSLLALCLAHRENFQEATAEAQQGIHLQPDLAFAHYAHAKVLFDRNRFDEARAAIAEAIRLDPAEADNFSLLAAIHCQDARWKEALAAAEQGLECDPEHVGCTNLRAMALVKLGRKAEAGATIDSALSKNPENSLTHANMGWTLLEKGQPAKALDHFREALRLDPENEWARNGIVEALKARHLVYAVMLKYFLWMSRFSRRAQWGIVLGAYFGNRLLGILAASNPELAPWVLPLRILYVSFAMMTWMASPFFNLLLRVNRFGRLALSREHTIASTWFGLCLLGALLSLAGAMYQGFNGLWLVSAMVFGFLLLPVSAVYRCRSGSPRNMMAILAISAALLGFGSLTAFVVAAHEGRGIATDTIGTAEGLFTLFLIACVASTWVTNILRSQRRRR